MPFELSPDKFVDLIESYGLPILWAVLIFAIGRLVCKGLTKLTVDAMRKAKVDETLVKFAKNLVYIGLMVFVILAALEKLGVKTTSFAAVLAAAGLAIGLALQGSLGNFASGVLLVLFRPFKVGDFVEAGGTSGSVESIQLFNTTLKTPDNKQVIVPNGQITSATITNFSANDTRRIDLVIGVGYEDDLKKVRSVLEKTVSSDERVLTDPEPFIGVMELADSSVNFAVRPWVKTSDFWKTKCDLTEAIKLQLEAEGINIPYPQRDVHLINSDAA